MVLQKTRCYLIGAIENCSSYGRCWREIIKEFLAGIDVHVFDPNAKPYIKDLSETEDLHLSLRQMRAEGQYDALGSIMKDIRAYDLGLVDKSDFVIFYFDPDTLTCGSWEEFFLANRQKKPIFFICPKGLDKVPLWVYGTIPAKYMYSSLDSAISMLTRINSGCIQPDSSRWRLLKPEFR